jgi:predicted TIM-barrel fold metal-dependent hydrolase
MNIKSEILNLKSEMIIDAHTHVGISVNNYLATASYPYCLSIEDLIVRMDFLGIDKSVVFPFESSYYPLLGEEKPLNSPAVSSFPYEKENQNLFREIFEIFPEYSERLIPFAMFDPSREVGKQAENMQALHEKYHLYGLKTVTTYIKAFVKDFQKPDNHIRKFALDNNLPLTFHCSVINTDPWANVYDVLEIAEANPDLRFAVAHSARFAKKALDKADTLPNCFIDISAFKIHCDLAVQNSPAVASGKDRFDANYANPVEVLQKLVETYPDTIIWGTDTPYHYFAQKFTDAKGNLQDSRLKASYDDEIKILKALPEELQKKISYDNTVRFLNSDLK